ncbi:Rieske 2Fe-2S domain-containing protein [Kineococcus terrestris]|uniref:Rieske 2Fe-2S domain-containing protein n=1 Tax=Kineococcus terrestris TaxID=2044856 RepID=UPI0034DB79D0
MSVLQRVFDAPSRLTVLDPLAARAKETADRVLPGGRVRGWLHGRPAGHPLHPAAAMLPVGTSVSALLLDAAAVVLPGGRALGAPARGLTAVSVAAAGPTAAMGWADYTGLHEDQQRTALVHAAGNAVAVALWSLSLVGGRRAPLLRTVGTLAAGAAGALGGHLAYRWAAGPNHAEHLPHLAELAPADADGSTDLGSLDELPEGVPTQRWVGDAPVCLLRRGARVHGLVDTCSHLGGPLHDGEVRDVDGRTALVCPWHGTAFSLTDGEVLDGPGTAPQPVVAVRVRGGRVLGRVEGPPKP